MAEFRLERFKYNWRGNWQSGIAYKRDDVIRLNGKSYVCVVTHTSSSSFESDYNATLPDSNPPQPQPRWVVMTSGVQFVGDYQIGVSYNLGDIVKYDGVLWTCVVPHTATGNPSEVAYWTVFADNSAFIGEWQSATVYGPGAIVKYSGKKYKAINAHQSGGSLEDNLDDWEVFYEGIEYVVDWQSDTTYRLNDLVKYGGTIFRCVEEHLSDNTFNDAAFQIEVFGSQFNGEWNSSVYYNIGDIVKHRGFMYYAIQNNYNSIPFQEPTDDPDENWILLARNYNFVGPWSLNGSYKTGDIVLRGGNLYQALRDIGPGAFDGSSTDYLDDSTWELVIPGKSWKGFWTAGTTYSLNDVVYFKGTAYTCNFEHEADLTNFPGDNGNVFDYWDILIERGTESGLQNKGDLLTYGTSRELDGVQDTSTLGNTNVPIGEKEQVLSVSADLEAYWRDIIADADAIYVATNGVNDINRGTAEKPFKTIRYAAEYVEDTFEAGTPVIIRVSAGRFEEIGPIVVPAGCAINGDELRSTTILATGPIAQYQDDYDYVKQYITRLEGILLDVLTGNEVSKNANNPETQITLANFENYQSIIEHQTKFIEGAEIAGGDGDPTPVRIETLESFPASNIEGVARITQLYSDFRDYVSFRIESTDVDPTITGSNALADDPNVLTAANALELNKIFIREELVAYIKSANPDVNFDDNRLRDDIWALLRGVINDMRYTGNYGTLVAAQRYVSAVLGSKTVDLFRMRDSTGLRDCTTGGLEGVLQPPQVFELYQRPTGGALVALDPGWGPDDDRTWITKRSPFMQSVTNTGFGCVGAKVDGALHNGGNKSMTANDFTQVLSDGVGVWVRNNARTELVSVFTYYCQIGYFAEKGGIIRATNGNNSYGTYGAISDGSDETEVPQTVTVNNRTNEAQVVSAFAGGASDEILLFEYSNAGEEYTEATANIIGSGSNASLEYTEIRDNALFEARLTKDYADSGDKGGNGYLTRQGAAQETLGATTSIKLSANDITLDLAEIEGMRLIITDGVGVGQYGIVSSFDFVTKSVDIVKESDGITAGWDHIIPGTPIEPNLDLTTRYRIEPRINVSSPGFNSSTVTNLFANRTYVGLEFANTKETFTNISGASQIPFEDDDGDAVTVADVVSDIALQVTGNFAATPDVPFVIEGDVSGAQTTVEAVSANTGQLLELDISGNGNGFTEGESLTIILVAGTGDTFDDDPVAATFDIVRVGTEYTVTLNSGGAGYKVGNTITIVGGRVGGTTGTNDIVITVTEVSDDSTAEIVNFTFTGTSRGKRFIALTNAEYAQWSDNGLQWTDAELPFVGDYKELIASDKGQVIGLAYNTDQYVYSETGEDWLVGTLPEVGNWEDGVYADGKYVIVASDLGSIYTSTNGTSWTARSVPDDTGGDGSSISQWYRITYGKGIFLAVSANDRATATSTDGGVTWTRNDEVLEDFVGAGEPDWVIVDVAYGDNRFIILDEQGRSTYSFDGVTWYLGGEAGGGIVTYTKMKYAEGVFLAIGNESGAATTHVAKTEYGDIWTSQGLSNAKFWGNMTHGVLDDTGTWVFLANATQTAGVEHIVTGRTMKLRADVLQGSFQSIKIWDPGSGYTSTPTLTVIDPNADTDIVPELRLGNGVLPQPAFINRGSGYRTSTSTITISGNGYADIKPEESILTLSGVTTVPGPGVQIRIDQVLNFDTEDDPDDLKVFTGIEVTDLGDDGSGNGTKTVQFTVTPRLATENNVEHGREVTLRERYSQCRISGHDFLDIGTGNFEETNYPQIYASGNYFIALPENEVFEANGGRVYYTSTDQDGNFRTGELFAVNQATGIVTISAQFFDLDGLSELSLGGVRLGGSGTVINEFSTDPTFAADSNSVVPTQRAIGTFLANRLSVGGENLEVNRLVAGRISVGGFDDEIDNITGEYLVVPVDLVIDGTYTDEDEIVRPSGIQGTIVSQMLFFKQFDENMQ